MDDGGFLVQVPKRGTEIESDRMGGLTGLLLRSLVKFIFHLSFEETPILVVEFPRKENRIKKQMMWFALGGVLLPQN